MEGPALPKSVLQLLDDYSVQDKELSWKFHDSKRKVSLILVWTSKSDKATQPPTVPCATGMNPGTTRRPRNGPVTGSDERGPVRPHPRTDTPSVKTIDKLDKPVNPKSNAAGKKKKSPSRLARDRRRLIPFKEKKRMERSQNHATSISAKSRVIQYKNIPKRIFLTQFPLSIPARPNTTASDMKNSIFNTRDSIVYKRGTIMQYLFPAQAALLWFRQLGIKKHWMSISQCGFSLTMCLCARLMYTDGTFPSSFSLTFALMNL